MYEYFAGFGALDRPVARLKLSFFSCACSDDLRSTPQISWPCHLGSCLNNDKNLTFEYHILLAIWSSGHPFLWDAGGQGFNPCLPQLATLRGWSLPPRGSSSGPLPLLRVWRPSWLVQGSSPAVNVFGVEWGLLSRAAGD